MTPSAALSHLLHRRARPTEPEVTRKFPRTRTEKGGWHLPVEEQARLMRENIAKAKALGLL